jgi:hypothetical protein
MANALSDDEIRRLFADDDSGDSDLESDNDDSDYELAFDLPDDSAIILVFHPKMKSELHIFRTSSPITHQR